MPTGGSSTVSTGPSVAWIKSSAPTYTCRGKICAQLWLRCMAIPPNKRRPLKGARSSIFASIQRRKPGWRTYATIAGTMTTTASTNSGRARKISNVSSTSPARMKTRASKKWTPFLNQLESSFMGSLTFVFVISSCLYIYEQNVCRIQGARRKYYPENDLYHSDARHLASVMNKVFNLSTR